MGGKIDPWLDFPVAEEHRDIRRLYRYWLSLASPGRLPGRAELDAVVGLPDLLPRLMLYDVVDGDGGQRFRVRVAGGMLVDLLGHNPTGRFIDEYVMPDRRSDVNEAFASVVRDRRPHCWENQLWTTGAEFVRMRRLALPLATDGVAPDMVLALYVRIEPERT